MCVEGLFGCIAKKVKANRYNCRVALFILLNIVLFATPCTAHGDMASRSRLVDRSRCLEIMSFADESDDLKLYGFFMGMSRHDARALADFYNLDSDDFYVVSVGEKAVYCVKFSLKGFRRMVKMIYPENRCDTFEEIVQEVANNVGDMEGRTVRNSYGVQKEATRKTIDGGGVRVTDSSILIFQPDFKSKMPIETHAAEEERLEAIDSVIPNLIKNMVDIPGKAYKIGKYEVTALEWAHIMNNDPSGYELGADYPVTEVSLDDCEEFLKRLNSSHEVVKSGLVFRLPTVKEWTYACRAGAKGDLCRLADGAEVTAYSLDEVAWFKDNAKSSLYCHTIPHLGGQKKPNAFGLYDMLGNVAEWTQTVTNQKDRIYLGGFHGSSVRDRSDWNVFHINYHGALRPGGSRKELGFRLCATCRTGFAYVQASTEMQNKNPAKIDSAAAKEDKAKLETALKSITAIIKADKKQYTTEPKVRYLAKMMRDPVVAELAKKYVGVDCAEAFANFKSEWGEAGKLVEQDSVSGNDTSEYRVKQKTIDNKISSLKAEKKSYERTRGLLQKTHPRVREIDKEIKALEAEKERLERDKKRANRQAQLAAENAIKAQKEAVYQRYKLMVDTNLKNAIEKCISQSEQQ